MSGEGPVLYEKFEKKNFTLKSHNMNIFAIVIRNWSKLVNFFVLMYILDSQGFWTIVLKPQTSMGVWVSQNWIFGNFE